jgi:hypothetical protein
MQKQMEEIQTKNKNRTKTYKGKIHRSLLLISNLLFLNFLIGEFFDEPDNDFYLIVWRICFFFITLFLTGAMITFFKPQTIKLIIAPILFAAIMLAVN